MLTLMAERSGRDVVVTVRDTGVGIPEDQLEKVFNLYFTTKATGSGIGLAMTYRILQLHHGKIDVQSIEGTGTAFTLLLPLVAPDTWPRSVPMSVRAVPEEAS